MMQAHGTGAAGVREGARRMRRRGLRPVLAVSLLSVAALLAACEGDNLFTGEGPSFVPRVTALGAPEVALGGDTIRVRVDAIAQRGISRVDISLRGAVTQDTSIKIDPPEIRVSQVVALPLPTMLQDTLILVSASITDVLGNISRLQETFIVVFGPPVITNLSGPSEGRPGSPILLSMGAGGTKPITRFLVSLSGAISKDTVVTVANPSTDVTANLVIDVPTAVQDTVLEVDVVAEDVNGLVSSTRSLVIPLAFDPPTLELTLPATVNAGTNLMIQVDAQGVRNIEELRLQIRGGVNSDITVPVDPTRTEFSEVVVVPVPAGIVDPLITVSAFAIDAGGAVSMTETGVVVVPLGDPVVLSVTAPVSVTGGDNFLVRVEAEGLRPLTRVDVYYGAPMNSQRTVTLSPARPVATVDVFEAMPASAPSGVMTITATATDASGAVSDVFNTVVIVVAKDTTTAAPSPASVIPPGVGESTAAGGPVGLGPTAATVRSQQPALAMRRTGRKRGARRRR